MELRHCLHTLFEPAALALIVDDAPPAWVRQLGADLANARVPASVLRLDGTALSGTGGPGIELALVAVAAP
ncbi:MAG: hypothetical protein NTV19_04455, partial [Burkholderiales bacterium]|nr:hypothetical protein [Burkholderiales bacterium]